LRRRMSRAHKTPGEPRVVDLSRTDGLDATRPLSIPGDGIALFAIPLAAP